MHKSHVNSHQGRPKLLVLSTKRCMFRTIDCEAPKIGLVASRPIPQFAGTKKIEILTSYHGLVCVGRKTYDSINRYSDLFLWNPLTNEYKKLSTNSHKGLLYGIDAFRLYYNSCEDDYKLLHLLYENALTIYYNVYIYSLKSDSWKAVKSRIGFRNISNWNQVKWSSSTSLNGNLYFLSYETESSIIKFDTKTEKLIEIETPFLDDIHNQNSIHASLMVHRGSIHLCFTYENGRSYFLKTCIELWKMNEDGYWKKVVTYRVDPYDIHNLNLKPLHLMSNGNLLMSNNENGENLYELKVKKKRSKGKGKDKLLTLVSTGICKDVRYSETFVSPNRYSN
ncbi:putative F-box domain-containing protein [Tanacetum coccineum]